MSDHGYEVFNDPYCYRGTFVLKNRASLRDAKRLQAFELEMSTLRAEEPLPKGRFGPAHYRAIHRHLFGDVYAWAGRYRTVRTAKGGNVFCYPEHIEAQMEALFLALREAPFRGGRPQDEFVTAAAAFLAELNAIHAFREGNENVSAFAVICIALEAGVMLGAFYALTGRLWVSIGVHIAWNFAQGYVFGALVSGEALGPSLAVSQARNGFPEWLTGGPFGPEASLPALFVCSAVGAVALFWAWRAGHFANAAEAVPARS